MESGKIKYYADFIACPGIKYYHGGKDGLILEAKIRLILDTALHFGYNTVILGALGIGAFGCNPKEVALCFKNVVYEDVYSKLVIVFAILGNKCELFREIIDWFGGLIDLVNWLIW